LARLLLCVRLIARTAVLAVVLLLLLLGLLLLVLLLGLRLCRHDAVVVLRMLEIILRHHAVAGRIGVTRKLQIFLVHIGGRASDFDFGTRRVECAVRIVSAATATTATIVIVLATACVLRPAAAST
jgi:hypothetical protein